MNQLFVATLRRATSIRTSMVEALAADDDDGDLTNGTPNECVIRGAYGRHGLRTAVGAVRAPGASPYNATTTVVRVELDELSDRCAGDEIDFVTLIWRPGFTQLPVAGSQAMTRVAKDRFWATLPATQRCEIEGCRSRPPPTSVGSSTVTCCSTLPAASCAWTCT